MKIRNAGIAALLAGFAMVAGAGTASAHVEVDPTEAAQGGETTVTFTVPDESVTAGTVKVEVSLPEATPVASVHAAWVAGWTTQVTQGKLAKPVSVDNAEVTTAPRTITWTAQPGTRLGPDQLGVFAVAMDGLPDNTGTLLMPVTQTYDDGSVVRWDAPPAAPGADEPELPAPALTLSGKSAPSATDIGGHTTTGAAPAATGGTDGTARWLAGAGLALGALGVGFGLGGTLRRRRDSPATTD
jgi:periplasmic copper chaperone A